MAVDVHVAYRQKLLSLFLSALHVDELYMTSISWLIPALLDHHGANTPSGAPNINTCRPMTYQEDGAKVRKSSGLVYTLHGESMDG